MLPETASPVTDPKAKKDSKSKQFVKVVPPRKQSAPLYRSENRGFAHSKKAPSKIDSAGRQSIMSSYENTDTPDQQITHARNENDDFQNKFISETMPFYKGDYTSLIPTKNLDKNF